MALTTINGQDGTADFSINGSSYACVLTEHELESNVDQIDSTTFCTETATVYEPGATVNRVRLAGLLKKGSAIAGPMLPLPQNAAIVQTFSAGCTLSYNMNFTRGVFRRTVKQNAVIAAEGLVTGAITKQWNVGP